MACEVIVCPMEYMTVIESDTDIVPFDPGSYASSTTYVTGTAAKMAAEELRTKIIVANLPISLKPTLKTLTLTAL